MSDTIATLSLSSWKVKYKSFEMGFPRLHTRYNGICSFTEDHRKHVQSFSEWPTKCIFSQSSFTKKPKKTKYMRLRQWTLALCNLRRERGGIWYLSLFLHKRTFGLNISPHENYINFAYMATFSKSHTCHNWRISDFSTSVMWRHLKFLHMWRNFKFPHNCHTWKAKFLHMTTFSPLIILVILVTNLRSRPKPVPPLLGTFRTPNVILVHRNSRFYLGPL